MNKVLITGICGFVGSSIAFAANYAGWDWEIVGIDNLIRPGSELNRPQLKKQGVRFVHGDIRSQSDMDTIGPVDWVIDAAANPSVLAGVDGQTSSRQLIEHNLGGTINLLEFCKQHNAGLILLSTSRVYSIPPLANLTVEVIGGAYTPTSTKAAGTGISTAGITESFSTEPPISLYGATKRASETLALEYSETFGFPCWINRCGVLAGAGQFGKADQGIFSFWIHSHRSKRPLKYIGFDGMGHQVRDCLHPHDLASLIVKQMAATKGSVDPVVNVSGGVDSACSLRQLTSWCDDRFGTHPVESSPENRPFDLPWVVLDSSRALERWGWAPQISKDSIFEEIALHAIENPNWLKVV